MTGDNRGVLIMPIRRNIHDSLSRTSLKLMPLRENFFVVISRVNAINTGKSEGW